jgi:hypothetical protein
MHWENLKHGSMINKEIHCISLALIVFLVCSDLPDYTKDYPQKFANKKITARPVSINVTHPDEKQDAAIVDIRSQDNKDRWIMRANPENGKLSLIDRQRDEAGGRTRCEWIWREHRMDQ